MPVHQVLLALAISTLTVSVVSAANCFGGTINSDIINDQQQIWDLRQQMCSGECTGSWPCSLQGGGAMVTQSGSAQTLNYCWDALSDIINQCIRNGWNGGTYIYGNESYYLISVPDNRQFTKRDNLEVDPQSTVAGSPAGAASIVRNVRHSAAAAAKKRESAECTGRTTSSIFYHAAGGYYWGDWEIGTGQGGTIGILITDGDTGSRSMSTALAITNGWSIGLTFGGDAILEPNAATASGQINAGYTWSQTKTQTGTTTCNFLTPGWHYLYMQEEYIWYEGYQVVTSQPGWSTNCGPPSYSVSFMNGSYDAGSNNLLCA